MKIYFNYNTNHSDLISALGLRMSISCPKARFQFKYNLTAEIPPGFPDVLIESGGYLDGNDRVSVQSYSVWLDQILRSHTEITSYLNLDVTYSFKRGQRRKCDKYGYEWPPVDAADIICQRCRGKSKPVEVEIEETLTEKNDTMWRCTEESMANLDYLERQGLKPIPVIHDSENLDIIDYYCLHYPTVAVDGMGNGRKRHQTAMGSFLVGEVPQHPFSCFLID